MNTETQKVWELLSQGALWGLTEKSPRDLKMYCWLIYNVFSDEVDWEKLLEKIKENA